MEPVKGISDLRGKKVLKIGLLITSTLFIVGGSVSFYDRLVYERTLSVSGMITGGSTNPTVQNSTPATVLILLVSAFVISLSVFGFLREAFRGKRKSQALVKELLSTIRVSMPAEIGPSLEIPYNRKNWEEAPKKEEGKP